METKMTNQEIKSEKERCFEQIKVSNKRLAEIRKICKHEKTIECDYSWRIGNIQPAIICKYCGEFIKYINGECFVLDTLFAEAWENEDDNYWNSYITTDHEKIDK